MREEIIMVDRAEQVVNLFGSYDEHVKLLEREYGVTIVCRDTELKLCGEEEALPRAKAAVEAVKKLSLDLNIPQTLREIKIPKDALVQLSKDAFADVCTGGNPRKITEKDILELYQKAY